MSDKYAGKTDRELLTMIVDKQLEQDQTLTILSNGLYDLAMDRGRPDIADQIQRDRAGHANGSNRATFDEPTDPGL